MLTVRVERRSSLEDLAVELAWVDRRLTGHDVDELDILVRQSI
jgi:hypothetical protein